MRGSAAKLFACATVAALAGGSAAAATPHEQHASSGSWRASFTYLQEANGSLPGFSKLHLTVLRGGTVVLDAPIRSAGSGASLEPYRFGGRRSLLFRDLDGDGVPELVLSLWTGGAHCCLVNQVFDLGDGRPHKAELELGNSAASLVAVGGRVLFRTSDDSFAYVFTDYADSGFPIAFRAYRHGRFLDVTASYPGAVRRDAAFWWNAYRRGAKGGRDVRGVLAAWAADEARLHEAAHARATLLRLAADGTLARGEGGKKGSAYVRALWRFLHKQHYLP